MTRPSGQAGEHGATRPVRVGQHTRRALLIRLTGWLAAVAASVLAGSPAAAAGPGPADRTEVATPAGHGATVIAAVAYALPLARGALPRSEYDDPHHDYPAIDLPVPTGTAAYASASGTVAAVDDSSCGIGAVITDASSVRHIYCHFSRRVAANGATVAAGALIGYTGSTGNSTGPHLHFAIKTGSTSRCPQSFLLALYDGRTPPAPATLPITGCFYATASGAVPLLDDLR